MSSPPQPSPVEIEPTMSINDKRKVNTDVASQEDIDEDIRTAGATDSQQSLKRPRLSIGEADMGDITKSYVEREKVLLVGQDGRFIVHGHKIKEFAKLGEMLENAAGEAGLKVVELPKEEHITKVLEVLYTPMYTTKLLDIEALVATLIFATEYEHPSLRAYVIKALGARQKEIPPVNRVKLARMCDVPEWIPKAIDDLSKREPSITLEEANELGPETFVTFSELRGRVNYNRGWNAGCVAKGW